MCPNTCIVSKKWRHKLPHHLECFSSNIYPIHFWKFQLNLCLQPFIQCLADHNNFAISIKKKIFVLVPVPFTVSLKMHYCLSSNYLFLFIYYVKPSRIFVCYHLFLGMKSRIPIISRMNSLNLGIILVHPFYVLSRASKNSPDVYQRLNTTFQLVLNSILERCSKAQVFT